MPENDIPVVRIVVKGCPSTRSEKTNVPRARNMLLRAFEDNHWPGNAMFAITPAALSRRRFRILGIENANGRPVRKTSGHLSRTPGRPWMKCRRRRCSMRPEVGRTS